jgi:23S rRNA U2552 (ribose-2'-O)-methylase RlmE/FtsJ
MKYLYEIKENMNHEDANQRENNYISDSQKHKKNRDSNWDIYKKYTNPYEYIDSIIPFKKIAVSKHKHLSRSYYKMIEIIHTFKLFFVDEPKTHITGQQHDMRDNRYTLSNENRELEYVKKPISSFHLAEGPGGFIEAFAKIRNCKEDTYIGMTLLDDKNDPNIPGWKKTDAFLKKNPNVFIELGADKTGNILSVENFVYCINKYGSSMEFITGDGGFDFSIDFNNQENNISKLLFAQICFAVCMQKHHGVFILKIFDCFMQHTVDLLYILSSFYEKVYITKPQTSRYANSEKYLVCKGFLFSHCEPFYDNIYNSFLKMTSENTICSPPLSHRYLNISISKCFLSKLEEYNAIFGQQQIENIHYTLSIIKNNVKQEKMHQLIKINIQKCIQWCIRYNVEYNTSIHLSSNNMFIENACSANSYIQ